MSLENAGRRPETLQYGITVGAAFGHTVGRFGRLLTLAAIPFVLSLIVAVLEIPAMLFLPFYELIFLVLGLFPIAVLGVALTRAILIGAEPGQGMTPYIGRRTWKTLGYILLMILIVSIPLALIVIVLFGATFLVGGAEPQGFGFGVGTFLAIILAVIVMLYVMARLGLVFPAIAVDESLGLLGAWRLTKGAVGMKLFGIYLTITLVTLVITFILGIVTGQSIHVGIGLPDDLVLPEGAGVTEIMAAVLPIKLIGLVITYVGYCLLIAAYASAFAQLSSWGRPRDELLKRFE